MQVQVEEQDISPLRFFRLKKKNLDSKDNHGADILDVMHAAKRFSVMLYIFLSSSLLKGLTFIVK